MEKGTKLYNYDVQMTFRTKKKILNKITALALKNSMSSNTLLNVIVKEYLKKMEGKNDSSIIY